MTITQFDRSTIRVLDHEINAALKQVADHFSVQITIDGGSYSGTTYQPKLKIVLVDDITGVAAVDPLFQMMCDRGGLDPSILSYDGYRLVGYKSSRPKFPWDIQNRSGRQMKATRSWVDSRFKRKAGASPTPSASIFPPMNPGVPLPKGTQPPAHDYTQDAEF